MKDNLYDSPKRLEALEEFKIMDTGVEQDFNEIVELASKICNKPISLISLVDSQRQWFKARVGLDVTETPVSIAFCKYAIEKNNVFIVEDATKDDRFSSNPLVTGSPDIRFYAGTPLQTSEGYNIGTLCVLDNKPGELNDEQLEALKILGKQVIKQFELKRAFRILQLRKQKIEEQQKTLKELLAFKDKIFAVVSHDLTAPINGLGQVLELMSGGALSDEEFKGLMPVLTSQVRSAENILENLLAWAKSQQSGLSINKLPIDINQLLSEVVGTLLPDADKKEVNLNIKIADNVPTTAINKDAITIVLRNLIKNSIKFCRENDVVTVSCVVEGNRLLFGVVDTGIGFDDSIGAKLFNPAEHVTTYGTAKEKGTGLGLLICKNLVEQNGGAIWAKGLPNQGASFYFTIPV
jgi:signal transduction histidine kinase